MNLVIEQRPRTITSNFVHQQSNDVNNHYSTSPLLLKFKRQNTNLQANILMSNEENNSIASNQRLKRSIPTNSSRRPSSPAFNGKKQQQQQQQSTKRSAIIDNNNNDLTSNIDENSTTKRFKQDDLNVRVKNFLFTLAFFSPFSFLFAYSLMKSPINNKRRQREREKKNYFFAVFLSTHQRLKWMLVSKQFLLV